jgi:hypothetical protein
MRPFYVLRLMFFRKSKGLDLLVLGAGRGGTSLISSLLDAHPQLEVALEEHAPKYLVQPDLLKFPTAQEQLKAFVAACDKDARISKLRYGNKITTEQLGFVEDFGKDLIARGQIRDLLMKDRKVVFIVRDGRTCISSKLERTGVDYATALGYWRHSVDLLHYFQSENVDLHLLKFEDLLQDPRTCLTKVCSFLEIAYSETMLSGTSSDRILKDYRRKNLDRNLINRNIDGRIQFEDLQADLQRLSYF